MADAAEKDDCEEWLIPIEEAEVPLFSIFIDKYVAYKVSWCFSQKIKKHSTPQQFEHYTKAKDLLDKTLDNLLFYKGGMNDGIVVYEMLYKFQSFVLEKLTGDLQYKVPDPYHIACDLEEKITELPKCLQQDIYKICNIQIRRDIDYYFRETDTQILKLFESITSDEKRQKEWMLDFYNLIYRFVILIRENEYLMNPINSNMFMSDWFLFEKMNGRELEETNTVPKPYPIPFP